MKYYLKFYKRSHSLSLALLIFASAAYAQSGNVGIGESQPGSKGSIKGNLSVGSGYSIKSAPTDGAIIEGKTGIGVFAPDASAKLQIDATDAGILIPRITSVQKGNIASPATGLLIYQTDNTPGFYYNSGTPNSPQWVLLANANSAVNSVGVASPISNSGTPTNPVIGIQQATTSQSGYLSSTDWNTFNNKQTNALSNGRVWIGDASNIAQPTPVTGDISITNTGVATIANDAVTTGKILDGTITAADLATTGVPANTYNNVTVNAQGQVTAGSNAAYLTGTRISHLVAM